MSTSSTLELLDLSSIVVDPDLQPREKMDPKRVVQYAEDMLAGIEYPPLRVFRVKDRCLLTSGFHRYHAAKQAGFEALACEVFEGTYAKAKWDAAGSNVEWDTSGSKRTNADKRRAVHMAWEAFNGKVSQRKIAEHAGVHQSWVSGLIKEWTRKGDDSHHDETSTSESEQPQLSSSNNGEPTATEAATEPTQEPPEDTKPKPEPRPTFNLTNDNVDWAKWTWNPVTGCEHNCIYCYARDIANRFYPEKFVPTPHWDRLEAPRNTKPPGASKASLDPIERTAWRNVFVCSMADLFGRWVPKDWIEKVFESCRQSPEWNYLFLTKFPQRYTNLDFPKTAWVGTSVDEQKRVSNAEKAFAKIDVPVKWLSVEPMLEPLKFNDLSMFHWVVIGGQSRSTQAPEFFPDPFWVNRLIDQAHEAGCKVYCKPNTDPAARWAGLFKEYPDAFKEAAS